MTTTYTGLQNNNLELYLRSQLHCSIFSMTNCAGAKQAGKTAPPLLPFPSSFGLRHDAAHEPISLMTVLAITGYALNERYFYACLDERLLPLVKRKKIEEVGLQKRITSYSHFTTLFTRPDTSQHCAIVVCTIQRYKSCKGKSHFKIGNTECATCRLSFPICFTS